MMGRTGKAHISSYDAYYLCSHICYNNNNNNNIDHNNTTKDGEDESGSAHLPAGTPTGCVSSSPPAEAGGGGTRGGKGGQRGGGGVFIPSQHTRLLDCAQSGN